MTMTQGRYVPQPINPAFISPSTRKAYLNNGVHFQRWCVTTRCTPFPASRSTVEAYLRCLIDDGIAFKTARRRLFAIAFCHREWGLFAPWMHVGESRRLLNEIEAYAAQHRPAAPAEDIRSERSEKNEIVAYLRRLAAAIPLSARGRYLYQLAADVENGAHLLKNAGIDAA